MNQAKASVASPTPPATFWKQRYETLRQMAVGGRQVLDTDPLGLVVLVGQGVAGWMRSWSELTRPVPLPATPRPLPPVASTGAWQQQLTQLLAQMSLAHIPNPS
jgi:hypothetical protein